MDIDNQTIVIPQTYKRYNGKLYSTIGINKPMDKGDCIKYKDKKITFDMAISGILKPVKNAYHTERIRPRIHVWYDEYTNSYYHLKRASNTVLIVYRPLFGTNDDTIYLESKKKFVRLMEFNNKKEYL